ncbi:hypothetical protein FWC63_01095 [Candidatus Saccharibacteria bacterium]|nr:hypothetical protein [Candidatus Saccharibacteria bacterium]
MQKRVVIGPHDEVKIRDWAKKHGITLAEAKPFRDTAKRLCIAIELMPNSIGYDHNHEETRAVLSVGSKPNEDKIGLLEYDCGKDCSEGYFVTPWDLEPTILH